MKPGSIYPVPNNTLVQFLHNPILVYVFIIIGFYLEDDIKMIYNV